MQMWWLQLCIWPRWDVRQLRAPVFPSRLPRQAGCVPSPSCSMPALLWRGALPVAGIQGRPSWGCQGCWGGSWPLLHAAGGHCGLCPMVCVCRSCVLLQVWGKSSSSSLDAAFLLGGFNGILCLLVVIWWGFVSFPLASKLHNLAFCYQTPSFI